MNRENILNATSRQFQESFNREGREVTNLFKNKSNQAFFRQVISNSESATESRKMFYSLEEDIDKGDMIKYSDDTYYLVYNKENKETFCKSFLKKTNLTWNIHGMHIPFVSSVMSSVGSKGSVVKVVNGIYMLTTSDTEYSRKIKVNDIYYDYGGCYEVFNQYYIDGLCFIHFQRTLDNESSLTKIISYDGVVKLEDNKFQTLFYISADNNYFPNAAITYTSSNTEIATVDNKGVVTFLKTGSVDITASYDGKELTKTISGIVPEPVEPDNPTEPDNPENPDTPTEPEEPDNRNKVVTVTSTTYTLAIGGSARPITATYIIDEVEQEVSEPIWSYKLISEDKQTIEMEDATSLLEISAGTSVNKIKVKFTGGEEHATKYIRVYAEYDGTKGYADYTIKFL